MFHSRLLSSPDLNLTKLCVCCSVLFHPDYVVAPVLAWGLFMAILLIAFVISISGTNFLERFNKLGMFWMVLMTAVLIIAPLVSLSVDALNEPSPPICADSPPLIQAKTPVKHDIR